jgi:TonB-linked SusC/RagA family outer membrane protein
MREIYLLPQTFPQNVCTRKKLSIIKRAMLLIIMFISCNFLGINVYGQQQGRITGTITDESGAPLPGVNVVVKGTTIGAITDLDGKYTLNVTDQNAVLVASFIGYVATEIPVAGKTTINITLKSEALALQEVVVVGYGVQKKVNVIGSITTLSSDEITAAPTANVSSALSGRLPGLFVSQSSGRPGADNSTLTIRGTATIANSSGNTNILVVVDGIPGRDLNSIEPGDIESLSVLKDASAGIYGSRAANGVILVTTKKGMESAPRFEYDFYKGWSSASIIPAVTDAPTYAQMIREVQTYRNVLPANQVFSATDVEKFASGQYPWLYPNTDWASAVLKDFSSSNHHTFRVSGGTKMIKYYGAFGAQTDDGIYKSGSSSFKRYNFRLNLDVTFNEYLSVGLNMSGSESDVMSPYNTSFGSIYRNLPTSTAIWPTGEPGPDIEKAQQPVTDTDASKTGYTDARNYRSENMLTATLKIPWVEGLSVIGNYSYDMAFGVDKAVRNISSLYFLDKAAYLAAGNDGSQNGQAFLKAQIRAEIADPRVTDNYSDAKRVTNSVKLNYDKTFGKHTVSTFVAVESMEYLSKGIEGYRRFFQTVDLPYLNFGGTTEMSNSSSVSLDARLNYFGRFAYNYSEKYLLEFTLRRDGSLRFSKEAGRWGTFPSVLLGWRASSEDFWKNNIKAINYFKLKASWGQLGNDAVNAFQYMAMFTTGTGQTFGSARSYQSSLYQVGEPNPEITWEVANVFNVGFESYMLDSKIKFDVDAFYQKRTDILVARNASVPAFTGLSLPDENYGIVTSKGIDAQLGYNNKAGQFSYGVTGNFSYARNKIIEYDEPARSYEYQRLTGHPTGAFLQYKAIGIFKDVEQIANTPHVANARPGDVILWDYNEDGNITDADKIVYDLNGRPEITFGVNLSLQYKNWQLQALVQGVGRNWKRIADTEGAFMYSGTFGNYYQYYANDRWTETNTDAKMHRAFERVEEYWRTDAYLCSFDYYNMAFARLKNLELSYTLPASFLNSIKVKGASVYVTGKNLFFLYNKNEVGYDPETMSAATYPTTRVMAVGARVSF